MNYGSGGSMFSPSSLFQRFSLRRGAAFGIIILGALIAFEVFNFSTTDYALNDLMGDLRFAGLRWSTILSLAFCGIDFAGIARLFTPEQGGHEPNEVWYLFGAWLLAATVNAMLTWWGVSIAIITHQMQSSMVIDPDTLMKAVPVFVAVMVWLIHILIIGSLSYAGDHLFSTAEQSLPLPSAAVRPSRSQSRPVMPSAISAAPAAPLPPTHMQAARPSRPAPKPVMRPESAYPSQAHPEPTYHNVSMRPRTPAQAADHAPENSYPSRATRR